MRDGNETTSNASPDSWEIRLKARLEQHGVPDPATIVARWKRHREAALARMVTDLRAQLRTARAATGPPTESNTAYCPATVPHERILSALSSIHSRIADAESRLVTIASNAEKALDRLERSHGELEKVVAVLKDRLPASGQNQQPSVRGLGTVVGFGVVLAVVVVTLILALSLMLRSVGA